MLSGDGGRSWSARRPPESLLDVVVSPTDGATLVAAGASLHRSRDAGRRRARMGERTGLLAWPSRDRLYLLEETGGLLVSADAGGSWRRAGQLPGEPEALLATTREELHAALHDGMILRSADGGGRWRTRSEP